MYVELNPSLQKWVSKSLVFALDFRGGNESVFTFGFRYVGTSLIFVDLDPSPNHIFPDAQHPTTYFH